VRPSWRFSKAGAAAACSQLPHKLKFWAQFLGRSGTLGTPPQWHSGCGEATNLVSEETAKCAIA
jgi:hypothetical protein